MYIVYYVKLQNHYITVAGIHKYPKIWLNPGAGIHITTIKIWLNPGAGIHITTINFG